MSQFSMAQKQNLLSLKLSSISIWQLAQNSKMRATILTKRTKNEFNPNLFSSNHLQKISHSSLRTSFNHFIMSRKAQSS